MSYLQSEKRTPKDFLQCNRFIEEKPNGQNKFNALAHYGITNKSPGEASYVTRQKGMSTRDHAERIVTDLYTTMQRRF